MKQLLLTSIAVIMLLSCSSNDNSGKITESKTYAYRATYSSNVTVPSNPVNAQKVLTVWKMFERDQIDSMKQYYADTVTYESADGHRFHGPKDELLDYARKDVESLDSLRFDISEWQSVHLNDKNEDWVYIWAKERRYKDGNADTSLIHEQWKIENGKVSYFNQYLAALPK